MLRVICKSKIQQPKITDLKLYYEGSIGIDTELMKAADILPGERLQVVNLYTGARFETYAIEEPAGSGTISLKGAAARLGEIGDKLLIISYAIVSDEEAKRMGLKVVTVDGENRLVSTTQK
ncbi:MAG: aspartate 1-decarboxylase [Candidatus Latescibacteria bacterium]|nr:aspartate 1-decarboxylase [Candidatus Latescibacterota bacterium]